MTTAKLAFLGFLLAAVLPAAGPAAEPAGHVAVLRGKALIERGEQARSAKVRDALLEQDTVLTRERSRAKLLFRNDSILTLGANSKLIVRKYLQDAAGLRAESLYELADGRIRAVVGSGPFKVQTPTAFAAARGTVFVLWYDPASNTTGVAVIEGGLEIRNIRHGAERMIILSAGQLSRITGNEGPSPPEPFSIDLWGGLGDGAPAGDGIGDISIEDVEDAIRDILGDQGGPGQPGGPADPFVPPPTEPPIDQQPTPPVTAPITVRPVFP